jgi:hypothetical protein
MLDFNLNKNIDIEYARDIRKKRSEIKSDLKAGKITFRELFEDTKKYEKYIANMNTLELVSALPGIGRVKAEKMLKEMGISFCKKIGGLGKNQKRKFYKYFNIQDS